jgi:hypothetical protein
VEHDDTVDPVAGHSDTTKPGVESDQIVDSVDNEAEDEVAAYLASAGVVRSKHKLTVVAVPVDPAQ